MSTLARLKAYASPLPNVLGSIVYDYARRAAFSGFSGFFAKKSLANLGPIWVPMILKLAEHLRLPYSEEDALRLFQEIIERLHDVDANIAAYEAKLASSTHTAPGALLLRLGRDSCLTVLYGRSIAMSLMRAGHLPPSLLAEAIVQFAQTQP